MSSFDMSWKDIIKVDPWSLRGNELEEWIDRNTREDDDFYCIRCGEPITREESNSNNDMCEDCKIDVDRGEDSRPDKNSLGESKDNFDG